MGNSLVAQTLDGFSSVRAHLVGHHYYPAHVPVHAHVHVRLSGAAARDECRRAELIGGYAKLLQVGAASDADGVIVDHAADPLAGLLAHGLGCAEPQI